ncbi:MAG: CotH kinase family protein [Dehalococcoidia bacterium]|nr:CotH kinase family protein [Dehalococcoidia bacterium]
MKSTFSVLLSAALLLSLAGCGDSKPAVTGKDDTVEDAAVPQQVAVEPAVPSTVESSPDGTAESSPDGYELLFTHGILHEIEIAITQEEWDGLVKDMRDYAMTDRLGKGLTGNYRKATFIYKGPAGDTTIEEVGFRTKGHWTRPIPEDYSGNLHRASFKVKFNKRFDQEEFTAEYEARTDRRFCRLRALVFRLNLQDVNWDTSQIRELYCYDLVNRAGVYTSKTGSATLTITIDGTKHYFGVYTIIEPIDKSFLTKRYGTNGNDGNLYKCLWGDSGPASLQPIDELAIPNPISSDERIIGVKDWRTHYRPTYDLQTNEGQADHTELLSFIDNLNTLSGAELKDYLDANFEIDRFLRYQAMNMLIGRWDDYWAMGNNYCLYFNNDGKIEFIPSDYDMALGGGYQLFDVASVGIYEWGNHTRQFLETTFPTIPSSWLDAYYDDYHSPLVEKIFEIDEYRATYERYLQDFITPSNRLFVYSDYEQKYELLHSLYSPHLDNDMDEGEEMSNDYSATKSSFRGAKFTNRGSVREYFHNKTKSIIDRLGLNEEDYDLPLLK